MGLGGDCFEAFGLELILIVFRLLWGLFDCAFGPLALAYREPLGACHGQHRKNAKVQEEQIQKIYFFHVFVDGLLVKIGPKTSGVPS